MNYRGIVLLVIFIIVHFIVYVYLKDKYSSKNKDVINIKYIVPPITYEDYFEFKDLAKHYDTLFGNNSTNLDLIKSETEK
jgi:hypothetical protein